MTLHNVFVAGNPRGQPRPRAFARHGKARVYDPGTAEHWKSQIALAFPQTILAYAGPVAVTLHFGFMRPKSHFRKGGGLTKSAPLAHLGKPDLDNAIKAVLDALTTIGVWPDDTQVVDLCATKRYADPGDRAGCQITIATQGAF